MFIRFTKNLFIIGCISGALVSTMAFVFMPQIASAQTDDDNGCTISDWTTAVKVQIPLPGVTQTKYSQKSLPVGQVGPQEQVIAGYYVKNMSCYIAGFYRYFAGVAGILATVMVIYGGIRYVVSQGNSSKMSEARDVIYSALIGLVITLGSYVILNFINPNLVTLRLPNADKVARKDVGTYKDAGGNCLSSDQIPCGLFCINTTKTPTEVVRGACIFCEVQDPYKTCGQQKDDPSFSAADGNCVYARCPTSSGVCTITALTSTGNPDYLECDNDGITVSGAEYGYGTENWIFSNDFQCGELHWKNPFLGGGFGVIGKLCSDNKRCVINNRAGLTLTVRNENLQDGQRVGSFGDAKCY